MDRHIRSVEDVLRLLDGLFARDADRWTEDGASWWDEFYSDRGRPVPFFAAKPDENLASYPDRGTASTTCRRTAGSATGHCSTAAWSRAATWR